MSVMERVFMTGYTLIELMVALTLLFILSLSTFSFTRTFIQSNHRMVQVDRLTGALNYARVEAIRQGEVVTFCGSSNLRECDGHWSYGRLVKVKNRLLRVFPQQHPEEYLA